MIVSQNHNELLKREDQVLDLCKKIDSDCLGIDIDSQSVENPNKKYLN